MCVCASVYRCTVLRGFKMNYIWKPPKAIHFPVPYVPETNEKQAKEIAWEFISEKCAAWQYLFPCQRDFQRDDLKRTDIFCRRHTHTSHTFTSIFLLEFHLLMKWSKRWCQNGFWTSSTIYIYMWPKSEKVVHRWGVSK